MSGEPNLNALSTYKTPRRIKFESKPEPKDVATCSPGPAYQLVDMEKTKFKRAPAISIASAVRTDRGLPGQGCPGPGAYGAPGPSCIQAGKGFGFGAGPQRPKPASCERAPGPGTYPLSSKLGGVEVSITCAPKGDVKVQGLGPGQYTPKFSQLENAAPAVSFTASSFGKIKDNKMPGPGQYSLPSTLNGNVQFRRSASYSFTTSTGLAQKPTKANNGSFCGQPTTFRCP
mmetsp:Transcript_50114/g.99022  ORF Transcript_50114/g.99022 Transcript_50114/m.99022 type:complete len:230 (+) Transcript_50114:99-788(+)